MSSSDGTVPSKSQNLDFPQDNSASEDDTNEKLMRDINDLVVQHGLELFLNYNSNILPNLSNRDSFAFNVKEKVFPDELKQQVQSLIGEYGKESYAKIVKRTCIDLPNLSAQMNDVVLDDCLKRKREESPAASHESVSSLEKYDSSSGESETSEGSVNVIPPSSPTTVFGDDEDESKRLKKRKKVAEELALSDGLTRPIKNISAKTRPVYSSDDHGEGQEKEEEMKRNLEEDESGSVQENESSMEENKMEDDKKDQHSSTH